MEKWIYLHLLTMPEQNEFRDSLNSETDSGSYDSGSYDSGDSGSYDSGSYDSGDSICDSSDSGGGGSDD